MKDYRVPRVDTARVLPNDEFSDLMHAVLKTGRQFRFRAPGVSMTPFIRDGDTITLASLQGGTPGLGDVLAVINPDTAQMVVHRVVATRGDRCLLKADAARQPDGWVDQQGILARVTQVDHHHRPHKMGLGPERKLIAALSRINALQLALRLYGSLIGRFRS